MISEYENKMLKINKPVGGKKKGEIIKIKVDKNGAAVDRYWRNRIADSKIDGCVEFVDNVDTKSTSTKAAKK